MTVLVVATCGGFAVGVVVGGVGKPGRLSRRPAVGASEARASEDRRTIRRKNEELRKALAEKEQKMRGLENELAELRSKLPPPLSPEEEVRQRRLEDERKRAERSRVLFEKAKALRRKIVQRKDKALREEGLAELAVLMQSDDPESLLLGMTSLLHLDGMKVGAERFKAQIMAATRSESPEICHAALNCLRMACTEDESLDILFRAVTDVSSDVRGSAAMNLGFLGGEEGAEGVEAALDFLLWDNDESVRRKALVALCQTHGGQNQEERNEKFERLAVEIAGDPEKASEVLSWWETRGKAHAEDAEHLGQMLFEGDFSFFGGDGYSERSILSLFHNPCVGEAIKPIMRPLCLRLLKDSPDEGVRRRVKEIVREEISLAELEEIAQGQEAAGIERDLAEIIEDVRGGRRLPSLKGRGQEEEMPAEAEE
jgi:hypothetical protein